MHSFPISKWAPKVKLMLSEKKNANLEGLRLLLSQGVSLGLDSFVGMGKDVSLQQAVSWNLTEWDKFPVYRFPGVKQSSKVPIIFSTSA